MFLDRDTLESVATILSQGFLLSAAVIGGAIVVAKLIEIFCVRRILNKRKKEKCRMLPLYRIIKMVMDKNETPRHGGVLTSSMALRH